MTLTETRPQRTPTPQTEKRVGYTVAVIVNALMLYIANQLMDWGWFPWLTDEFDRVLPWISLSLGASIVVNLMYHVYDMAWFKSLTQSVLAVVSVVVTYRIYRIFPFDFSAYDPPWTGITEAILIFVMMGAGIAAVVEGTRFMTRLARASG